MTPQQEAHLTKIVGDFTKAVGAKYRKGQAQHGGDLWRKRVLPMLIEECVDLPVYALTLQDQIERAISAIEEGSPEVALNILKTGNAAGAVIVDDDAVDAQK